MDKEAYLISRIASGRVGDDGAVIGKWVYSMDAFCEGIHFRREWMDPYRVGRKAMRINLSDAVAMNADPRYALAAVSLPPWIDAAGIEALVEGLEGAAGECGCELIGGDTVAGERLELAITLVSYAEDPLYRTGIRPGDLLAFTGTLGRSLRDLRRLMAAEAIGEDSPFFEPPLRREFVRRARPLLRAGMDLSDGLFCDTDKLLAANGLGIEPLREIAPEVGMSGEEYEMLVAFDPAHRERLERIAAECGHGLTVFARAVEGGECYPCTDWHSE
ncbi:thiamine-phosphate kinase [Nitratifractor sp.]